MFDYIALTKGGDSKFLSPTSSLIPLLLESGWKKEGCADSRSSDEDERQALLREAKSLGLSVHHKLGVEKLQKAVLEARGYTDGGNGS